ncbi:MAG: DUF4831 family protein [Paludibacteraceae bacterium]|nr:DUF4831 family protein [Paludibacteraceae bacterium]
MKRLFYLVAAMVCGTSMWAETVKPDEMAMRYYMPKTEVVLQLEYVETTYVPGKYAAWAQQLLGVDYAIQEDSTAYSIEDMKLVMHAKADTSRMYTVRPEAGAQVQLLSMTPEGLLYGYNVQYNGPRTKEAKKTKEKTEVKTAYPVSTLEETVKSDSLPKQAMSVAKQIYQLRDNRIYLLSGDAENQPADGVSMKAILEEIDRQEKALVELFMGRKIRRTHYQEWRLDPAQAMADSVMICMGGDTIRVSIVPTAQQEAAPVVDKKAKKQKGAPTPSQIYYNLPGTAEITVSSSARGELIHEVLPVAQLGVSIPLAQELFNNPAERVRIRFDVNTGNILSIRH